MHDINISTSFQSIKHRSIDRWMSSNRLKLNTGKTEFNWLGTRQQLAKLSVSPLQIKNQVIIPFDKSP